MEAGKPESSNLCIICDIGNVVNKQFNIEISQAHAVTDYDN